MICGRMQKMINSVRLVRAIGVSRKQLADAGILSGPGIPLRVRFLRLTDQSRQENGLSAGDGYRGLPPSAATRSGASVVAFMLSAAELISCSIFKSAHCHWH